MSTIPESERKIWDAMRDAAAAADEGLTEAEQDALAREAAHRERARAAARSDPGCVLIDVVRAMVREPYPGSGPGTMTENALWHLGRESVLRELEALERNDE